MKTTTTTFAFLVSLTMAICCTSAAQAVTIATVPVGNAGNAADFGRGAVAEPYRIGKTEVTNSQYTEFLNAVAATDTHALFNSDMNSDPSGGISQSGSSGSFTYSVKTNMGNKPVNYVSFWDAARFTNWLDNGQSSGAQNNTTTEDGAYFLDGVTNPVNASISRDPGATWFLPTADEWHKAAYYQPASEGGDSDDYWLYPTASNSAPTIATASGVGDISNPGANVANYALGADWNGQDGNVTTVGSAGVLSESFYGTSDQGGNVFEWNEAIIGSNRSIRGGSSLNTSFFLQAFNGSTRDPTDEDNNVGFRVASIPEQASLAGDFDFDSDVDGADFLLWQRDLNVGALSDWESTFGVTLPLAASITVPEPATGILLLGMASVGALMRRRRLG